MALSSSAPDLPQEIQDLCIDELAHDEDPKSLIESLQPCLLVSQSFYQHSRRHLWSSVDLELKDDERSHQKVSKLLDLMNYVPPNPPTFTVIEAFVLDTDLPRLWPLRGKGYRAIPRWRKLSSSFMNRFMAQATFDLQLDWTGPASRRT
ncbi:hypothetical protein NLJ89_g7294 [Agrocybe chaxingu]|uniref:F-box domain-containing protein n=1 Tax=Agrocybe chaxingu TaxID=84603 RepID=A0A9W8JZE0_9AGAR|nr:hypothetical protein NLJ89_g7294 [Agrocybe chaxingu]